MTGTRLLNLERAQSNGHLRQMKFYELAVGARFEFDGRQFEKIGMSMAEDEKRNGCIFMGGMDVIPAGEPMLLSAEEAAKWKPADTHWTDFLAPAPGQVERRR